MLLPDCDDLRAHVHGLLLAVPAGAPELLNELEFALLALRDELDPLPEPPIPVEDVSVALDEVIDRIDRLIDEPRPVADLIALGAASRHLVRARTITGGRA